MPGTGTRNITSDHTNPAHVDAHNLASCDGLALLSLTPSRCAQGALPGARWTQSADSAVELILPIEEFAAQPTLGNADGAGDHRAPDRAAAIQSATSSGRQCAVVPPTAAHIDLPIPEGNNHPCHGPWATGSGLANSCSDEQSGAATTPATGDQRRPDSQHATPPRPALTEHTACTDSNPCRPRLKSSPAPGAWTIRKQPCTATMTHQATRATP